MTIPPMTTPATPRSAAARILWWVGLAYLVVSSILLVVAFVRLVTQTAEIADGIVAIIVVVGWALLFFPFMLAGFRIAADRRAALAAREHPHAYLMHVVARPSTRSAWSGIARALGIPTGGLPWNNYALFVADPTALRLYAGNFVPSQRVAIPTSQLVGASIQPVTVGIRTLHCIVLGIADATGAVWRVELTPIRWSGILVRAAPAEWMPAELAAMRAATHPGLPHPA